MATRQILILPREEVPLARKGSIHGTDLRDAKLPYGGFVVRGVAEEYAKFSSHVFPHQSRLICLSFSAKMGI